MTCQWNCTDGVADAFLKPNRMGATSSHPKTPGNPYPPRGVPHQEISSGVAVRVRAPPEPTPADAHPHKPTNLATGTANQGPSGDADWPPPVPCLGLGLTGPVASRVALCREDPPPRTRNREPCRFPFRRPPFRPLARPLPTFLGAPLLRQPPFARSCPYPRSRLPPSPYNSFSLLLSAASSWRYPRAPWPPLCPPHRRRHGCTGRRR